MLGAFLGQTEKWEKFEENIREFWWKLPEIRGVRLLTGISAFLGLSKKVYGNFLAVQLSSDSLGIYTVCQAVLTICLGV